MSLFPVNFKQVILYSQTAIYHCLQAIHSTIEILSKRHLFFLTSSSSVSPSPLLFTSFKLNQRLSHNKSSLASFSSRPFSSSQPPSPSSTSFKTSGTSKQRFQSRNNQKRWSSSTLNPSTGHTSIQSFPHHHKEPNHHKTTGLIGTKLFQVCLLITLVNLLMLYLALYRKKNVASVAF